MIKIVVLHSNLQCRTIHTECMIRRSVNISGGACGMHKREQKCVQVSVWKCDQILIGKLRCSWVGNIALVHKMDGKAWIGS